MTEGQFDQHLNATDVAAWADGALAPQARLRLEAHLSACDECRQEVAEVCRIVHTLPERVWDGRRVWISAAVAASLVFLLAWPRQTSDTDPRHREAVTTTVAPRPLAPLGAVDSVTNLVWSATPFADSYRARLFDQQGTVIWQVETADTMAVTPTSVHLQAGRSYYWRVEARTGFDRVAESELNEFVVRRRDPR